eukprot:gb/GECG01008261.1/.p1 GENE.gb/GECG01008261.1/~~gb/GECG01008261.1/.p1  ORF type:complete len:600 (+),score=78.17 gb/GECG01008261.1/:1-1800(+)
MAEKLWKIWRESQSSSSGSLRGSITTCNWIIPGVLLAGGYPGSSNSEEHESVIEALVKSSGVTTFVCLQCRDELEDNLAPYMPIAARIARDTKRPKKFKAHESSFMLTDLGEQSPQQQHKPDVQRSASFSSVIHRFEELGDMESTRWSVDSTHSQDSRNYDQEEEIYGHDPERDQLFAPEQQRRKRSKTQTTEEELTSFPPVQHSETLGEARQRTRTDSWFESAAGDLFNAGHWYHSDPEHEREGSYDHFSTRTAGPFFLTEDGVTQLYFPIRDGEIADDAYVMTLVQHLGLRIAKAMKINEDNLSLLQRSKERSKSKPSTKLWKRQFSRAKSSGNIFDNGKEDANHQQVIPGNIISPQTDDGCSTPDSFFVDDNPFQADMINRYRQQSTDSSNDEGALIENGHIAMPNRERASTTPRPEFVSFDRVEDLPRRDSEGGGHISGTQPPSPDSRFKRPFVRSSSDSFDVSDNSDPSYLSSSVCGNGSEDETPNSPGNLSRKSAIKQMKPHEVFYVHCYGGHGRTGTIVSLLLVALFGIDGETAMQFVNHAHSFRVRYSEYPSPESYEQVQQVLRLTPRLQHLHLAKSHTANGGGVHSPMHR